MIAPPDAATSIPAALPDDAPAYRCLQVVHHQQRPPLTLAIYLSASTGDAVAWLITRSRSIAEQLDPGPRRQLHARVVAPDLQHHILRHVHEGRHVHLEIADAETVYELSVRPWPAEEGA